MGMRLLKQNKRKRFRTRRRMRARRRMSDGEGYFLDCVDSLDRNFASPRECGRFDTKYVHSFSQVNSAFMKNVRIVQHPLIERDLSILRNRETPSPIFRHTLQRLTSLLAYEVTKQVQWKKVTIATPLERTTGAVVAENIILIPVLRAGLGMVDGFLNVLPEAKVGHIGVYRNEETLEPVQYYSKYPARIAGSSVYLLDPMLATGGSVVASLRIISEKKPKSITVVSLVAAPEGIQRVRKSFPKVLIYTAALDRELNSSGYILPGLGDAGDRIFGTE